MNIKRFEDVTQAALEVVLGELEEPTQYYRALFPEKFTSNLSWETLEADGNMTVAADVVAHDASVKLKTRPSLVTATGKIPKIGILERVSEEALHNLFAIQANPRGLEEQIFEIIFGDVARVYYGTHARLEILGMMALSTGKAETTDADNVGITYKTTFKIPAANKAGVANVWSNPATATPIKALKAHVKLAKNKGFKIQKIVMDQDTFDFMLMTEEVRQMYSAFIGLSNALVNPTGDQINTVLSKNGLPSITVIDPSVAIEKADGTQEIIEPWSAGKIALLSSGVAGRTQYTLTAEEKSKGYKSQQSLFAKRDIVGVTRWDKLNPYRVFTKGETVAFPVLNNPKGVFLLDTLNASFTI